MPMAEVRATMMDGTNVTLSQPAERAARSRRMNDFTRARPTLSHRVPVIASNSFFRPQATHPPSLVGLT